MNHIYLFVYLSIPSFIYNYIHQSRLSYVFFFAVLGLSIDKDINGYHNFRQSHIVVVTIFDDPNVAEPKFFHQHGEAF